MQSITQKDFVFQQWTNAAAASRKILMDDIIIRAGKQGILISPIRLCELVREFNNYLDPQAMVKVVYKAINLHTTQLNVMQFLKKNKIVGAKSTHR